MKKILFMLPLLAVVLVSCNKDKGDDEIIQFDDPKFQEFLVNVHEMYIINFPDENWDWSVPVYVNYDKNGDGQISMKEAAEITTLSFGDAYSATGEELYFFYSGIDEIKYFPNLEYLCNLHLTTDSPKLDVSQNIKLKHLILENLNLSTLDISNNTELTALSCYENRISNLDISKNIKLQILFCDTNELTLLDVSNNTELLELHCSSNQIRSLDISNNIKLREFDCSNNPLETLTISESQQNAEWLADVQSEYPNIKIEVKK